MTYIDRNNSGEIIAIFEQQQIDNQEYIAIDNPELIEFIRQTATDNDVKTVLSSSDIALIRVLEDLIHTLIDKNIIQFIDLPLAAQDKLVNREKIREHLTSLENLMADDEGIL